MLGREVLGQLPLGQSIRVGSVKRQCDDGTWRVCEETKMWAQFWNNEGSGSVAGDPARIPKSTGALLGSTISALSLMTLMRLHPVIPAGVELLDFSGPVSAAGLAFNAVMLGRLRSGDYLAWMRAFHAHFGRWPFEFPHALAEDVQAFVHSYEVPTLNRISDTTLELKRYMRCSKAVSRRNHELIAPIAADTANAGKTKPKK